MNLQQKTELAHAIIAGNPPAQPTEAHRELVSEREKVRVLREALVFIVKCGGMNIDTELGQIPCDGNWCAEQARAALAATEAAT